MLRSHALDSVGDDLAGTFIAFYACLGFDLTDDARHVSARFLFSFVQQDLLSLLCGKLGDALQFFHLVRIELFDIVGTFVQGTLAFVQVLLADLQLLNTRIHFGAALLQPVVLPEDVLSASGDLRFRILQDLECLVTGFQLQGAGLFSSHLQQVIRFLSLFLFKAFGKYPDEHVCQDGSNDQRAKQ